MRINYNAIVLHFHNLHKVSNSKLQIGMRNELHYNLNKLCALTRESMIKFALSSLSPIYIDVTSDSDSLVRVSQFLYTYTILDADLIGGPILAWLNSTSLFLNQPVLHQVCSVYIHTRYRTDDHHVFIYMSLLPQSYGRLGGERIHK